MIKQPSILLFLMFFIAGFCQKNNTKIENLQNFDKQKLHFGYFIGFNQYNYKLDYKINPNYATWIEESIGVNIGLIGDLRINEYINLRFEPGLHTNKLNLRFNERSKFTQNSDTIRSVKSSYIHIPLLIKLSTKRLDNFRPYLIGGVSTSFNLSSNQNSPEDNKNNIFRLKANNLYYELGFGIDFYNNKEIYTDSNLTNDENLSRIFFSFKTGTSIGYNGKKFYFGSELKYHAYSENFDKNEITLQPSKIIFQVFLGYRFKAPKQVSKPLDYIEDKVPALKKENKN